MKKVFSNCSIYTGKEILKGVAILVNDGIIEGFVYEEDIPAEYELHDLGGNNITASFIDVQIYGGNGLLFATHPGAEAILATHQYCISGGCTDFLLTIATNSHEVVSKGIAAAKKYLQDGGKGLLGLHLEGPWINAEKRGAHLLEYIHPPAADEVKQLVDEADGIVKMITLAPEVADGGIIDFLQDNGIVISAGHSNATYPQAIKAFEKIKTVTHLFNAMSPLHSREPGLVGAVYDHPAVCSSIVADGIHVDFAAIRISKKILGERLFLITDAVAATNEGPYQHTFKNDRYTLPDGTLSGSALTMMQAVKNCVQHAGISPEEALRMANVYPAKIIGIDDKQGWIQRNQKASFAVFDHELNLLQTIDG